MKFIPQLFQNPWISACRAHSWARYEYDKRIDGKCGTEIAQNIFCLSGKESMFCQQM
jgi:hypothetical protein